MIVYLLGARKCENCDYMAAELAKAGIPTQKIVIDPTNEEHMRLVEESKAANFMEAPIICVMDESEVLQFIVSGRSNYALLKTKSQYKQLVAA